MILDTQTNNKSQHWLSVLLHLSLSAWLSLPEGAESSAAFRSKVLCLQVLGSQQNLTSDLSKLNRPDFLFKRNRTKECGRRERERECEH